MIAALAFYMFAGLAIFAGLMVVVSRNPVHSVLFLILAFFNAAGLFVLLGAEFLAMILIIVYVGAVAVLFLFVVMMLDIDFSELRQGFQQYLPLGGLVGMIVLGELLLVLASGLGRPEMVRIPGSGAVRIAQDVENTAAMGQVLFTDYIYLFQTAGMILLVSMIGAIVLAHRTRPGVKKQIIADQVARTPAESIELIKVETGKGVKM